VKKSVKPVWLIVDDDHDDQFLLGEALRMLHLDVALRYMENGWQVLGYLKGKSIRYESGKVRYPALIILDLNMPYMDGRETLKVLKTTEALRDIPVIVMTTSRLEEDRRSCMALGANGYYNKPNNFLELKDILKEVHQHWGDLPE
jgi:CheY-like chemotaxis protein